jgi:hypothetical protein
MIHRKGKLFKNNQFIIYLNFRENEEEDEDDETESNDDNMDDQMGDVNEDDQGEIFNEKKWTKERTRGGRRRRTCKILLFIKSNF